MLVIHVYFPHIWSRIAFIAGCLFSPDMDNDDARSAIYQASSKREVTMTYNGITREEADMLAQKYGGYLK